MQSNQKNQNINKDDLENKNNKGLDQEKPGSNLSDEEKEFRKYDDYKAHKHEKQRDLNAEFREAELHGVVGKEIHDLLEKDKSDQKLQEKHGHQEKHQEKHHEKHHDDKQHDKHHDKQDKQAQSQDINKNK